MKWAYIIPLVCVASLITCTSALARATGIQIYRAPARAAAVGGGATSLTTNLTLPPPPASSVSYTSLSFSLSPFPPSLSILHAPTHLRTHTRTEYSVRAQRDNAMADKMEGVVMGGTLEASRYPVPVET
jgi:hypothetical protein